MQLGCKRVILGHTYFKAFNRDNVTLVTDPIKGLTQEGIHTEDGTTYNVDTIVYATGFDILETYKALNAFTTIGAENPTNCPADTNGCLGDEMNMSTLRSLRKEWDDTPNAYLGITLPDYPNAFLMLGPGTGLGTNSVIFMLECQANYIGECLSAMIKNKLKVLNVKKTTHEEYQAWSQDTIKDKAYNSPSCTSWYKNVRGVNWTLWPTFVTKYWLMTRSVNLNDYNYK